MLTWIVRSSLVVVAVAPLACTKDNPAFDAAEVRGSESSADTTDPSTTDPSTTDPSTTDPSTTDSSTTDPDPTDPTTTDSSTTDPDPTDPTDPTGPIEEDIGPDECSVNERDPIEIIYGDLATLGQCPDYVAKNVKVVGSQNGDLIVNPCNESCYCDDGVEIVVSAAPNKLNMQLQPPEPNNPDPYAACYYMEVEGPLEPFDDQCHYSALSIFDPDPMAYFPLIAATRNEWGLTETAWFGLDGWEPDTGPDQVCACEFAAPEYECCRNQMETYEFVLDNVDVVPGAAAPTLIQQLPYLFVAQQAQAGVSCGDVQNEISWLIVGTN